MSQDQLAGMPSQQRQLTAEELLRERRCANHKVCACDHTECFDGWLDEEVPDPTVLNPNHTRVARCPHCYDAALMAAEQADRPKGWRPRTP